MADCQLGAYATFSGMNEEDIALFAERDMRVEMVPKVEGFEWDAARYREAIEAANHLRPDFVVMGGDMIDDPASREQYEELMAITAGLDREIPMRWVPGNHDAAPDTVVPTSASLAAYRAAFGDDYYAFDHGDVRFIVLNTVVIDHPEDSADELAAQMEFLGAEVDRIVADDRRGIVFGHHPLFLKTVDEEDTYWNLPLERRRHLLAEFRRGRISHAFAGHWHRNSIARKGGFEMVTSGPVGYPLGTDGSGFRVVRVESERIVHDYRELSALPDGESS